MWKKIEPLVAGFWMGMLLAHNPWWVSAIFIGLISVVALASYLNRHVRSFSQLREEWPVRYRWLRRQVRRVLIEALQKARENFYAK